MNRTAPSLLAILFLQPLLATGALAQESAADSASVPQDPDIKALIVKMKASEAAATRIRLELITEGMMPGGLEFETRGKLRVLRTPQGEVTAVHSTVEFTFADGLAGRMESVRRPDGVEILETNPTFGEVFVTIDAALLADLEWAGQVLQRDTLPGMGDPRAASPLGSAMVEDLAQRFALVRLSRNVKQGQDGTWYGGDRRTGPGAASEDPELPLADRVELFVRGSDAALLEVAFLQGGEPLQRITVENLVVGEAMPVGSFRIEGKAGARPRDVREHAPMWEQIQHLLESAERAADGEVRPSKREKNAGK